MGSLAITNATVVLPDRVIVGGAVVIHRGIITDVATSAAAVRPTLNTEIDAHGALVIPGLVDLHNDGLEIEVRPRPMAELPLDVAFPTCERRLVASGVTTEFHAISFGDQTKAARTLRQAAARAAYIADERDSFSGAVEHHVLHRVDVWSPQYLDEVFESIARLDIHYLSLNDHTPGQGQYGDLDKFFEMRQAYVANRGHEATRESEVYSLIAERRAATATLDAVYRRVGEEADRLGITIASHDDDSPEKVEAMWALGARVAEFPVTIAAAQKARSLGMSIVVGAPNIVRGGSSSGNLDATQLFRLGLADIICADYHAPSLLPAVFKLASDHVTDLPTAIRAVTLNPARAVGLQDRGAIEPGMVADLNIVRLSRTGVPHVESTIRRGQPVFSYAQGATAVCRVVA